MYLHHQGVVAVRDFDSVMLGVHGNRMLRGKRGGGGRRGRGGGRKQLRSCVKGVVGEPRTATSTFTQMPSSD